MNDDVAKAGLATSNDSYEMKLIVYARVTLDSSSEPEMEMIFCQPFASRDLFSNAIIAEWPRIQMKKWPEKSRQMGEATL